jgi:hypothetical protein
MDYKTITVQDLVDLVTNNPDVFKDGMKTKILSGDFEGNYCHKKHEIMSDTYKKHTAIFLGYEMHEGWDD